LRLNLIAKKLTLSRELLVSCKFLRRFWLFLALVCCISATHARGPVHYEPNHGSASPLDAITTVGALDLPTSARQMLTLIKKGGPYSYKKDGVVFGNYERLLPAKPRGYYHEFTVTTPGQRNRGAQRLIVGGKLESPHEFYYTADHYATFIRIID
jgi:ribonuclease T1